MNLLISQSVVRNQHSPLAPPTKVFVWGVLSWGAFSGNILKDVSWSLVSGSHGQLIISPCGLELDTSKLFPHLWGEGIVFKESFHLERIRNKIKSVFVSSSMFFSLFFDLIYRCDAWHRKFGINGWRVDWVDWKDLCAFRNETREAEQTDFLS